jgi:formimidoylglutamate deiminase
MYQVALSISPAQLQAVATKLYRELLQGGYTQVCEFHYLHHAPDGAPYADPLEMAWALVRAAKAAGIGLTLLPVLYERAGFSAPALRDDQRRFASSAQSVWQMHRAIKMAAAADGACSLIHSGIAIHSLRAASMASIQTLAALAGDANIPIHIHISEQTGEVDDCLKTTGQRPIDYLGSHICLDSRWQFVHATHANHAEIDRVAKSGAGLVMCPTTEANLGDGVSDMPYWLNAGVPLSIGSDSHVSRDWREELRWLEYGQRIHLQQRNVLATQAAPSVACRLFDAAVQGGGRAAGFDHWGLRVGARADLLMLDSATSGLQGVPIDYVLDAYVFGCDKSAVQTVIVAGQCVYPRST